MIDFGIVVGIWIIVGCFLTHQYLQFSEINYPYLHVTWYKRLFCIAVFPIAIPVMMVWYGFMMLIGKDDDTEF